MMVEERDERESSWDLTMVMLGINKVIKLSVAHFRRVFTVNRIEAPGRSTWGREKDMKATTSVSCWTVYHLIGGSLIGQLSRYFAKTRTVDSPHLE